jgi:putative transposase
VLVLEYKVVANKKQMVAIEEAIRTTQFIRNKTIRYWMEQRRESKINKIALNNYSTALRKEFVFAEELNSMACQSATERAWTAISRFYDNCKKGKVGKKGYPRFQHDNRSVEYKTCGWSLHQTKRRITFTDKKGIGELKLLGKWDIHAYPNKSIKRVRIVKRADGFYVQFCLDIEVSLEPRTGDSEIGLDVGLEYFYSDSNGHHEQNPRFLRKAEKSIKHSQRQIYKKEKGKNQRRKARVRYARKHLRVSRQRNEHSKRLGRDVSKANALVAYEDLSVKNMVLNHCLAKSINDVGWTLFRQWLEYFATKFGTVVVAVPPQYTSQKCSSCGVIVKKSLSVRTHACKCGCVLHRDPHARINTLNIPQQTTGGHPGSNATGLVTSTLLGGTLAKQVTRMNVESPPSRYS